MPSIDRLVATRYGATSPHPLTRRPWRQDASIQSATDETIAERVRGRLAAVDRRRRHQREASVTACFTGVVTLLAVEGAVLRWPQADLHTAGWVVHTMGALLIVLSGLRHVRDGLFQPAEMAMAATAVTVLLVLVVAGGLGWALWTFDAPIPSPVLPPEEDAL